MSRGFHFWQSQPLDRVTPSWLVNPRLPTLSPQAMPKGPPSWPPSLERRGSWLGEAWALYSNLGGIHYFLKGITNKLELSSFQKMYSIWRYLVNALGLCISWDLQESCFWGKPLDTVLLPWLTITTIQPWKSSLYFRTWSKTMDHVLLWG